MGRSQYQWRTVYVIFGGSLGHRLIPMLQHMVGEHRLWCRVFFTLHLAKLSLCFPTLSM
ncbi:hypothetical protein THIOKS13330033 [Thiocapsa sp. KS1]|nr:hypothetical protein THIOKS13330033 [Thiocapsa sp. KS1]